MGISEKKQSAPFLPSALLRSKLECLLSVLQVARKAAQRCSKTLDELSFIFFHVCDTKELLWKCVSTNSLALSPITGQFRQGICPEL